MQWSQLYLLLKCTHLFVKFTFETLAAAIKVKNTKINGFRRALVLQGSVLVGFTLFHWLAFGDKKCRNAPTKAGKRKILVKYKFQLVNNMDFANVWKGKCIQHFH